METAKRLEAARRALARAEESVGLSSAPSGAGAPAGEWSVPDALSWLFPRGLSRGMTVGVRGSRLAALLVAGIASGAGAWSVFLGCAGTGWAVAASLGVDLDRTVCVPRVGEAARSQVLAAAVDGFDVAVIGSSVRLDARERRPSAPSPVPAFSSPRDGPPVGASWGDSTVWRDSSAGRAISRRSV